MSFITKPLGNLIGSVTGSNAAADASSQASATQAAASQAAIDEQRRQFDAIRQLLQPYVQAGTGALSSYGNLLGTNGNAAQQTAINGIMRTPAYTSALQQGENAILSNAAATGGLRGGNVQRALGEFSPQLLTQLVNQQLQGLGGLSSLGQNAAAGTGNAGLSSANSISQLLQQQGAATAGGQIAQGQAQANNIGGLFRLGGALLGGLF